MLTSFVQSHLVMAFVLVLPAVAPAYTYQIDDGTAEQFKAPPRGRTLAWLNSFRAEHGAEVITSIDLTLFSEAVYPLTVYLWTDPTNDGNPIDASVVRSIPLLTGEAGFVNVPIAPITLAQDTWFFAGGLYTQPQDAPFVYHPAALDMTTPVLPNRSYSSLWLEGVPPDPNDLSANAFTFGAEVAGNYLIRVNAVPEPSTIILAIVGAIGFGALSLSGNNSSPWGHSRQFVSRRHRTLALHRRF